MVTVQTGLRICCADRAKRQWQQAAGSSHAVLTVTENGYRDAEKSLRQKLQPCIFGNSSAMMRSVR